VTAPAARYLLLHDGRPEGLINAAVLSNLYRRQGAKVIPFERENFTYPTAKFWDTVRTWIGPHKKRSKATHLILAGITFDDRNHKDCLQTLSQLSSLFDHNLTIWTHRWPDGYEGYSDTAAVSVSPWEIAEEFHDLLHYEEIALLRLSLAIGSLVRPTQLPPEDRELAIVIRDYILTDGVAGWDGITKDPAGFVQHMRGLEHRADPLLTRDIGHVSRPISPPTVFTFELGPGARGVEEHAIARLLDMHAAEPHAIGVAHVEYGDRHRVYMFRKVEDRDRPSIAFLLERYGEDFHVPAGLLWKGGQDSRHVDLRETPECDPNALVSQLFQLAVQTAHVTEGQRNPVAGMTRLMTTAGQEALRRLDLLKRYTVGDAALTFDAHRTRILYDASVRTAARRATLQLPLRASTARAAAFLLRDSGRNLAALQGILEGVLLGASGRASAWLGLEELPTRLRVNVEVDAGCMLELTSLLQRTEEAESISLDEARTIGLLSKDSGMTELLRRLNVDRIIVQGESQTIGPSVHYAVFSAIVVSELADRLSTSIRVLDLFTGSGSSARAIRQKTRNALIHCVDAAIGPEQVRLENEEGLVWLTADARRVLGPSGALSDYKYDVACLDPPHGALYEFLFAPEGAGLLDRLCLQAEWMVMYQGHSSQRGLADALVRHISTAPMYPRIEMFQLGQENVLLAGPTTWQQEDWSILLDRITTRLRTELEEFGWRVERLKADGAG
jgi:hypothetical protein